LTRNRPESIKLGGHADPSARWAFLALARLGGFTDTKRTGRPGWATIWHGWFRLQERVEGYRLAKAAGEM